MRSPRSRVERQRRKRAVAAARLRSVVGLIGRREVGRRGRPGTYATRRGPVEQACRKDTEEVDAVGGPALGRGVGEAPEAAGRLLHGVQGRVEAPDGRYAL
jgi:hypothetical protein